MMFLELVLSHRACISASRCRSVLSSRMHLGQPLPLRAVLGKGNQELRNIPQSITVVTEKLYLAEARLWIGVDSGP